MTGQNRAQAELKQALKRRQGAAKAFGQPDPAKNATCVFISHQQEDTDACRPIADYLLRAGIDVYFDIYDTLLPQLLGDPDKLTARIREGIDLSTHMICVVSANTIKSYWVPFEVGYAYDEIRLGILTLKDLAEAKLPDYMKTKRVIRGTSSLNTFVAELLGESEDALENKHAIAKRFARQHPLDDVLNRRL